MKCARQTAKKIICLPIYFIYKFAKWQVEI